MNAGPTNILFIVSSLCVGGAEKHTVALANHLNGADLKSHLCYLKPVEALLPQVAAEIRGRALSLDVRKRVDRSAIKRLRAFIRESGIDVIVATNEYPVLYAQLAVLGNKRPPRVAEVFHTTDYDRLKSKVQMLLYRPLFRRCDLLVYVSEKQMAHWQAKGLHGKRDIVIHNGVDLQRFQGPTDGARASALRRTLGFSEETYIVGICAALRSEKAHVDLLEALRRLQDRGVAAKGLLIGDGPERANIERRIAGLHLQGSVVITGFQDDVRPFISICDVVALTSHAVETFSIAALEAMAMGKPLVLTRIGGAEEQVTDGFNGFVFEPGDIDALAGRLAELQDGPLRRRMGAASRERVEALFSEQRMFAQFKSQIAELARLRARV
jgi:glycosyltransferase involved in cell wall biosynthesis